MADRSTVVVTGGAGFIGSELVRQLAARGERVVIVDNLVNGKRENVADVLSRHVTLLVTDIRDVTAIDAASARDAGRLSPRLPRRAPFGSLASREPRGERDRHAAAARGRAAGRRAAVRLRLELGGVRRRAVHADPRGTHRRGSPGLSLHRLRWFEARRRVATPARISAPTAIRPSSCVRSTPMVRDRITRATAGK